MLFKVLEFGNLSYAIEMWTARASLSRLVFAPEREAAGERGSVVVTLDADFHSLLATAHATTPSAIRIRIEGLSGDDVANILEQVVTAAEADLEAGAAVSVTRSGIRIRLLPLI